MHLRAMRCKEMYGGPKNQRMTVVFGTVGQTIEGTQSGLFGELMSLSSLQRCASSRVPVAGDTTVAGKIHDETAVR